MKKARRVPRKVGQDDEDEATHGEGKAAEPTAVVKRPASSKPKKPSSLRTPFAPGAGGEDEDDAPSVQKPTLRRHALERAADHRLPLREGLSDDRPSYSADHLAQLRSSTPRAPRDLSSTQDPELDNDASSSSKALDIASKFGSTALTHPSSAQPHQPSAIPTDAEIREKKERRKRLAAEQDFISLDDDAAASSESDNDDPRTRSLIIPAEELSLKDKYGETRLVREDEDIAEGFDSFVEDAGKVTLGARGAREQERQRRADIEAQIRAAQAGVAGGRDGDVGGEDDDDDDDEVDEEEAARIAAYEAAQTRFGTYGSRSGGARAREKEREERLRRRLQDLPVVSPLPEWKGVVARFAGAVREREEAVEGSRRRLEEVRREREEVEKEEERVKVLLREAGERFERAQREAGAAAREVESAEEGKGDAGLEGRERGLDSIGGMAAGSGGQQGLGSVSGMAQIPRDDEYSDE